MTILAVIFFLISMFASASGQLGVSIISVGMLFLLRYAQAVYNAQDYALKTSPLYARKEPCTLTLLDQQGCESSVPNLPIQISKSDLEI